MKYLIILAVLAVSCVTEPKETQKFNVKYVYPSTPEADIIYCDPNMQAVFNVYKWEKTVRLELGDNYCLSVKRKNENNNIGMKIHVYINDRLVETATTGFGEESPYIQGIISF